MTRTPSQLLEHLNFIQGRDDKSLGEALENLEIQIEKDTCKILDSIGIHSSVKTLRKSLPYSHEVTGGKGFTSFINDSIDIKFLQRKLLKELLDDPVYKIRLFCHIELINDDRGNVNELKYYLRYFRH